jgi:hypothetical protein
VSRGCTPGLSHRWSWWCEDWEDGIDPPEDGDIAIHPDTGSCYLVLNSKRSSRKGEGWWVVHVEGLGVWAKQPGEEGTFSYKKLVHADYEEIRMIQQARAAGAESAGV